MALDVNTFAWIPCLLISLNILRARCHCLPFSHALIVALYVNPFAWIPCLHISLNILRARWHRLPFSQAPIVAGCVNAFALIFLLAQLLEHA